MSYEQSYQPAVDRDDVREQSLGAYKVMGTMGLDAALERPNETKDLPGKRIIQWLKPDPV